MEALTALMPVTLSTNEAEDAFTHGPPVTKESSSKAATTESVSRVLVMNAEADGEAIGYVRVANSSSMTLSDIRRQLEDKLLPPIVCDSEGEEEEDDEGNDNAKEKAKNTKETSSRPPNFHFVAKIMLGDEEHDVPVGKGFESEEPVSDFLPVIKISFTEDAEVTDGSAKKSSKSKSSKNKTAEQKKEDKLNKKRGGFKIDVEEVVSPCTGETAIVKFMVFDKKSNEELVRVLRCVTGDQVFYNEEPRVPVRSLIRSIQKLREQTDEARRDTLAEVVAYLEEEYKGELAAMDEMIKNKEITFDSLWYLFQKKSKVQARELGYSYGFEIKDANYHSSWMGVYFSLSGMVVKCNGTTLYQEEAYASINGFKGIRNINDLPVQPLTDTVKNTLIERGKKFVEHAKGFHYRTYSGSMFYRQWCGVQNIRADGRCMVDGQTFGKFNSNYRGYRNANNDEDDEEEGTIANVADDMLYTCWPLVFGFSFFAKRWGEFAIDKIAPVKFDSDAFERLVLHPEKKSLIKALVKNQGNTFSDIISGKSGGLIFLLHGAPGTGKTVTAESISELLQKPLYSVSVGELGTTTTELEEKLCGILELSHKWSATVLLDEADIFLQARTQDDIQRNALVGIFLRQLEYHEGVLFMTTNRVSCFDEAFHSRIAVALRYAPLDSAARRSVWENLLDAAGVTGLDLDELATYPINGRQIKSTIRLAQSLAHEENTEVSLRHVSRTVKIAQQFQEDLNKSYDA